MDFFHYGPDCWLRIHGWQFAYHRKGRRRLFSERQGWRKGPRTIRVGRRAEISWCKIRPFAPGAAVPSTTSVIVPAGTEFTPRDRVGR